MNKVLLVAAITLFYSNFAMSAPIDPTRFVRLSGIHAQLGASNISSTDDFCYMDSAYVVFMDGYNMISATLVWNHEKNRPLRCVVVN